MKIFQKPVEKKETFRVAVTGFGSCVLKDNSLSVNTETEPEVMPWLLNRKMFKFMGKQDALAVVGCGRALERAGLLGQTSGTDTGLFLSVGYIPFERETINEVTELSTLNGEFSSLQFSNQVMSHFNPLITFKCLPNMPIFHTSLNFGIQGRYFISYPGVGQFYAALETAISSLENGESKVALVGGAADQNNFLVAHHFSRLGHGVEYNLVDTAGFLCLEGFDAAKARNARIYAVLENFTSIYKTFDILSEMPVHEEKFLAGNTTLAPERPLTPRQVDYFGPASLVLGLEKAIAKKSSSPYRHSAQTIDGFQLDSTWQLMGDIEA